MKMEKEADDKAFENVTPCLLKTENNELDLSEIFDYNSTNVCSEETDSRDTLNIVMLNDKMEIKFNQTTQNTAKPFESTDSGTQIGIIDAEQTGEEIPMTDPCQTNSFPDYNQQSAQDTAPLSKSTKTRAPEEAKTSLTEKRLPAITNTKTPKEVKTSNSKAPKKVKSSKSKAPKKVKTSNSKAPDEVGTSITKAPLELIKPKAPEEVTKSNPPAFTNRINCTRQHVIKFECLCCGNMYGRRAILLLHMVKMHGEMSKQTICDVCGKKLATRASMIKHRQRNHEEDGEDFICITCSAKFKKKWQLRIHVEKTHLPPAQKKCKKCAKEFAGDKSLREHLCLVHGIDNPDIYLCPVCGKSLTGKDNLERHMLIHSDEKPHACEECGKCFRTESNLYQHARSHSEERPFKCDVCDKAFRIKHHLKQHMATHGMTSVPKYSRRSKKTC